MVVEQLDKEIILATVQRKKIKAVRRSAIAMGKKTPKKVTKKKVMKKSATRATSRVTKKKVATSAKKKVTIKKRIATSAKKKVASKKKATAVVVPISPAVERLTARLQKAEDGLKSIKVRQEMMKQRIQKAALQARKAKTEKAKLAVDRAKLAFQGVTERKGVAEVRVRDISRTLTLQLRTDTAEAKRQAALHTAVATFKIKFLKDYDRRIARRAQRVKASRKAA